MVAAIDGIAYVTLRIAGSGQTIGMKMMHIRCVDASSGRHPIGLGRSLVRCLASVAMGIGGIPSIIDFFWPIWDSRNQTLHDKLVSTVVVRLRRRTARQPGGRNRLDSQSCIFRDVHRPIIG